MTDDIPKNNKGQPLSPTEINRLNVAQEILLKSVTKGFPKEKRSSMGKLAKDIIEGKHDPEISDDSISR